MKIKQSSLRLLIREAIEQIFESDTQYQVGDRVEIDSSYGGGLGTVEMARHPFYAIKFDQTGTTDSFHFSDLRPFDDEEEAEKNADIDTGLDEGFNPPDVISLDVPLFIRMLEYAREDAKTDMDLHDVAEKMIALSITGRTLNMGDYEMVVGDQSLDENALLNENVQITSNLKYHLNKNLPLHENIFRYGSDAQLQLFKEARELYASNSLKLNSHDKWLIENSDIGEYGEYEGKLVSLDVPFLEEEDLNEAEFKGKDVQLNKPKRGGSKKFYVYVKDGDKVKKVSFGDTTGLSTKVNDPKARRAFAARQNCDRKKDRTTPGYWSCNIGRYWKSLGGSSNFSGYW